MSEPNPTPDTASASLDQDAIKRLIPHRHPFLFVESVEGWEKGKTLAATKTLSLKDEFFAGHFPAEPVMPGVIQIEALAQACCLLIALSFPEDAAGKRPAFIGIEEARFRKPVRPGDVLRLYADLTQYRRGFATFTTRAEVNGERVCDAVIKAAMV
jgi:3-hydroxyacyl-[acyl-carrier-protein] dehydratase